MRLERLEISGFKSFSDRSELAFDRGVTAIVGPNGCGKSNVADAITWVLGEQSAKSLRGDKMEDVIFNGSDARKPTGAAEVRLRLSGVHRPAIAWCRRQGDRGRRQAATAGHGNGQRQRQWPRSPPTLDRRSRRLRGDARDVEVTRRLYRSGESEYLIDGAVVPARDVHELLMDTGLGAKAYAIIEQGKIGMILSSRPTDRRQLIEEAAGITKYKSRRRSAELKLEAAQQNLTRIDDIVFEVEKQRGTLKRQAAKARRYKRLRDELRRWEKVLFARRYRELAEAIEAARTRLPRRGARGASPRRGSPKSRPTSAGCASSWRSRDAAATSAREAAHARELEINRRQQQIAFDRSRPRCSQARAGELDAERQQLEARREPARLALEGRRQAAAEAERSPATKPSAAGDGCGRRVRPARSRRSKGSKSDVEARARRRLRGAQHRDRAHAALEHAGAQRERAVETLGKLELEASDLAAELERARAQRQAAADALLRAQDGLDAAKVARAARESELASARIEHEWRARDVRSREHELAVDDRAPRSLEELDAARAGFGDAARMVLVQANGQVGQQGAVADFSRSSRATSARSKRASAICCSTSSSSATITPPPACSWCASRTPAAAASSSAGPTMVRVATYSERPRTSSAPR